MKITNLENEDIEACLRIYNYYIKNTCFTLEEDLLDLDTFTKRCNSIKSKFPFIVARDESNNILGYAYLNTFNPRSAYRRSADLSIYIDNNHTHEHLGKYLLDEIIKLVEKYNIDIIVSIVTSENENSVKFHLKNNFTLEGTLHNVAYKFNKDISISYFVRHLSK